MSVPRTGPPAFEGGSPPLQIRGTLERSYADVYTAEALATLRALAPLNEPRRVLMAARIRRRAARARDRRRIAFLDPGTTIPGTGIGVQDARDGKFVGSEIPADLRRQWIQGTGPATKPHAFGKDGTHITENLDFEARP